MKTAELSNEESFQIINDMIGKAKQNIVKGGSFYFLFWGVIVSVSNIGSYLLEAVIHYPEPYIVWVISLPAGMYTAYRGFRQKKQKIVSSHLDDIYGMVWLAFFINMILILVFMAKLGMYHNAIILLLAGSGTFISGQLLHFKPLIFGGVVLWVASGLAFMVSPMEQNLIAGIAIILGYIIPGIMLRRAENE